MIQTMHTHTHGTQKHSYCSTVHPLERDRTTFSTQPQRYESAYLLPHEHSQRVGTDHRNERGKKRRDYQSIWFAGYTNRSLMEERKKTIWRFFLKASNMPNDVAVGRQWFVIHNILYNLDISQEWHISFIEWTWYLQGLILRVTISPLYRLTHYFIYIVISVTADCFSGQMQRTPYPQSLWSAASIWVTC